MTDAAPQARYDELIATYPRSDDLRAIADPDERIALAGVLSRVGKEATKVRDEEIKRRLKDGDTQKELGLRAGVDSSQMVRYARKAGIPVRGSQPKDEADAP